MKKDSFISIGLYSLIVFAIMLWLAFFTTCGFFIIKLLNYVVE
jgi:uncharacterized membrane protein YvlD (DUF360 family)